MKKTVLGLLSFFMVTCTHAQLTNTQWKTKIDINGPVGVILDFKKDTCSLYTIADSTIIETMAYTVKDSLITLYKIDGQSDCDNSTPGAYKFIIVNNSLALHMASDNCDDRSSAIDNTNWQPWVVPVAVKVDEAVLKQYTGTYQFDAGHAINITLGEGRLWAEGPNNGLPKTPLITEGNNRFFIRLAGVHIDFVRDAAGKVIQMISHEEKDYTLQKVN